MQPVPTSRFPAPLRAQLEHAERLARLLATLYCGAEPGDPARLWLTGRSDEVGVFVADICETWTEDGLATVRACDSIARYLRSLQRSLESWYGERYAPACSGSLGAALESGVRPGLRMSGSGAKHPCDTMPEAPPAIPRASSHG
jgi:hypothetical protein